MINLVGLIEMFNTYGHKDIYHDVAACLLKNYNRLDSMTSAQIAELCNVSPSTLNRFYRKMSYTSTVTNLPYIVSETKENYRFEGNYIPLIGRQVNETPIDFYLRSFQESLSVLYQGIDQKQIKRLIQDIISCNKVLFIGCLQPQTIWMLQADLTLLGIETCAYLDPNSQYNEIEQIKEGTVVFYTQNMCIGTNKYSEKILGCREKIKKLVVITNHFEHPLYSFADYSFSLHGNGIHQDLLLINLYIQLIALTLRDEVAAEKRNKGISPVSSIKA